jgi:UDP-N-acetylglucosamine transferase subunit ALG13
MTGETAPFTVVASVGTYHHPFDRFVQWLEPWTTENHAVVVFQHGCTRPMQESDNHEMFSPKELLDHYSSADAIVLQGGAGGVMDARKVGRIPIVVPRIPVDHEVVDNHQVVLCRRLADLGLVHVAESADDLARLLDGVREGTVPSRVKDSGRPSPGVAETVRLLTNRHVPRASFEQRDLIKMRTVRHPGMLGAAKNLLLRRGLLGHLLGLALPLVFLAALRVPPLHVGATIGLIALWLLCTTLPVSRTNRARSIRPAFSLIAATAVGAALAWFGVVNDSRELRLGLAAALIAAATLLIAALLNRLAFRRIPIVLIGADATVRRLVTQWGVRDDVEVAATCTWRDGIKPDQAGRALSRLLPEVMELVTRNQIRSAVFAADEPVATATMKRLSPDLNRAGAQCVLAADLG